MCLLRDIGPSIMDILAGLDRHPLDVHHLAAEPTAHTNSEHSDD
jgi:hypothetical protein